MKTDVTFSSPEKGSTCSLDTCYLQSRTEGAVNHVVACTVNFRTLHLLVVLLHGPNEELKTRIGSGFLVGSRSRYDIVAGQRTPKWTTGCLCVDAPLLNDPVGVPLDIFQEGEVGLKEFREDGTVGSNGLRE